MPKIAYQGEPGAFSHEACRRWFPDHEPAPFPTFEQAFDSVAAGDCALGMIPVENSVAGRVSDVHHLLPASGLKIVGERFLPIHMPKNTAAGIILGVLSIVFSFAMIWYIWWLAALSFAGIVAVAIGHTFNYKRDFYIPADVVTRTEEARTRALAAGA